MTKDGVPVYLGAYWGSRRENAEQCAERLVGCMTELAEVSGLLETWYRKGRGRTAKVPVVADRDAVVNLLLTGRNRRDIGGQVIDEVGFHVGVWNGDRLAPVSLGITCGAYAVAPGIVNSVVLDFPEPDTDHAELALLYSRKSLEAILGAVVNRWNADWAVVATDELRDSQSPPARVPFAGRMTYLAKGRPVPTTLPPGTEVHGLHDGVLISLKPQGDAEIAQALAVRDALAHAGSLQPMPL